MLNKNINDECIFLKFSKLIYINIKKIILKENKIY